MYTLSILHCKKAYLGQIKTTVNESHSHLVTVHVNQNYNNLFSFDDPSYF